MGGWILDGGAKGGRDDIEALEDVSCEGGDVVDVEGWLAYEGEPDLEV